MPKPTIADVMREYAKGAVAYAKRAYGMDLNYSELSLSDIDAIIAKRIASGFVVPDDLPASEREELWTLCKVLGGYVGEVILRNLGGAWETQTAADGSSTISVVVGGVRGSPPEGIWRAHTEDFKSIVTYYRTLRVAMGHGVRTSTPGRSTNVTLPPLSAEPRPDRDTARAKVPSWKFWRS